MSHHELQAEIDFIDKNLWTSVVINDRELVVDDFSFSLHSKFYFRRENPEDRDLKEEQNLPGTIKSIQRWILYDGSTIISFKPISTSCYIDLVGQFRPSDKMLAYVASDSKIMVVT